MCAGRVTMKAMVSAMSSACSRVTASLTGSPEPIVGIGSSMCFSTESTWRALLEALAGILHPDAVDASPIAARVR